MANTTIATVLEPVLRDKFAAIAARHNVSISAYLRAIVVDVIAEEEANEPSTLTIERGVPGLYL